MRVVNLASDVALVVMVLFGGKASETAVYKTQLPVEETNALTPPRTQKAYLGACSDAPVNTSSKVALKRGSWESVTPVLSARVHHRGRHTR